MTATTPIAAPALRHLPGRRHAPILIGGGRADDRAAVPAHDALHIRARDGFDQGHDRRPGATA